MENLMGSRKPDYDSRSREFVRLFQRNERKLYGYILSLVPNIEAADEISQETNLRLWEQFDQFDPSKDFIVWACTIAYYQVLTYRTMSSREFLQFDSNVLELLADQAAGLREELAAEQSYLVDCLSQLSDFKREVLRLYYSLGMTAKAVAERLGRSVTAVEQMLVRTRRTLHDCVERAMRREDRV
jgi:RNA polymerase sigma-70 factor, ECF subfamily